MDSFGCTTFSLLLKGPEEEKFSCYGADVSNTGIRCHLNMLLENPSCENPIILYVFSKMDIQH